MATVLVKWI